MNIAHKDPFDRLRKKGCAASWARI